MDSQQSHMDVTYLPGRTIYGSGPARLVWTDDRITLTKVEGTKDAPIYTEVFNAGIGQIEKVSVMLDQIRFYISGKHYNVSVAPLSTPAIAVGGAAGLAVGAGMYQSSGAPKLIAWLQSKNVRVKRFGYGALIGIALGVAVLVMGGIIIATAIN